jgi:hypothetical protein
MVRRHVDNCVGFEVFAAVVMKSAVFWEGAGIAQSVQRLATGCKTEGSKFESRYGQEFSPRRPNCLSYTYTYPVSTESSFPGDIAAGTPSWPLTSN